MNETVRGRVCRVVFGTDTPAGKLFDIILLWLILASVAVVLVESVPRLNMRFLGVFFSIELFFTGLFTMEYFIRIWS
jgi:voltage-gated potassium channel